MSMKATMRVLLAFLKKDFLIAVSYRFHFLFQIVVIVIFVGFFYLAGKFVDMARIPLLQPYGGNYFGFLLIGVAFSDYLTLSLQTFADGIREGQVTGTLEIIFASPTTFPVFLFASSLSAYLFTSLRILLYLLCGAAFFGLDISKVNFPSAALVFVISILMLIGIGILNAALVLVVKRGDAAIKVIMVVSLFLGGIIFPPEALPGWIRDVSGWIPLTYCLKGLRLAILEGQSIHQLTMEISVIVCWAAAFLSLGSLAFPRALKQAKMRGSISHF